MVVDESGKRSKKSKLDMAGASVQGMGGRLSIIVSGLPAVGKTTVAKAIADRFNLRYYSGGDILKELAIARGYMHAGSDWWDREHGIRFLEERESNPEFDRYVDDRLMALVRKGGVVVTSYTLPWLMESESEVVKILLKGSREKRAERMSARDAIPYEEALRIVTIRDERNKRLYRSLYNIDLCRDTHVFDFVISTDDLEAESVIDIACNIVGHLIRGMGKGGHDARL
ncbi:MAG: cytidylate kinase family protein [Candidatus Nitrosocaldus sp.]|nr:cytidylate kinase family protein [Candidatus Nitrosocaldus sp.]MCS7140988.1 cytidylate kinase family protein [Candidatus Nitrosocaldus sp.]MDW7999935.1 cytidylate kinase family protein [Candidatus Nitrosocaldus sp.]MDW8275422.1 cytidylate kinase family protein [Candidatus Nitrosocaldus sp.]